MNLLCSNCQTILLPENMNIVTDLGKCNECNAVLKLSELTESIIGEVSQTPPMDSKIKIESIGDGTLVIALPKNGITIAHQPMLIFAVFWLGAIGLFTYLSAGVDVLPVFFSIPFWAFGIFMIYNILKSSLESQKITITEETIKIEHFSLLKNSTFTTNISDIQDVTLSHIKPNQFSNMSSGMMTQINNKGKKYAGNYGVPTILSYANNQTFFENTTQENQIWVTAFVKDIVTKMNDQ